MFFTQESTLNTQTETVKKLEALLLLVSEVMRDIPQNILSEAAKELQQKVRQSASAEPTDEANIKKLHDVIWLTSQMYKDLNHQELSEAEQRLVAALQEGGFLTHDPELISPTAD